MLGRRFFLGRPKSDQGESNRSAKRVTPIRASANVKWAVINTTAKKYRVFTSEKKCNQAMDEMKLLSDDELVKKEFVNEDDVKDHINNIGFPRCTVKKEPEDEKTAECAETSKLLTEVPPIGGLFADTGSAKNVTPNSAEVKLQSTPLLAKVPSIQPVNRSMERAIFDSAGPNDNDGYDHSFMRNLARGRFFLEAKICKKCAFYDVMVVDMVDVRFSDLSGETQTYWAHKPKIWVEIFQTDAQGNLKSDKSSVAHPFFAEFHDADYRERQDIDRIFLYCRWDSNLIRVLDDYSRKILTELRVLTQLEDTRFSNEFCIGSFQKTCQMRKLQLHYRIFPHFLKTQIFKKCTNY